jgi:hypothetical protein
LQYQKAVKAIQKLTQDPDALLTWVCRYQVDCLDPRKDPLELTPRVTLILHQKDTLIDGERIAISPGMTSPRISRPGSAGLLSIY